MEGLTEACKEYGVIILYHIYIYSIRDCVGPPKRILYTVEIEGRGGIIIQYTRYDTLWCRETCKTCIAATLGNSGAVTNTQNRQKQ